MTTVAGTIERVTINNRIYTVAADADSGRDIGGFANTLEMNGDGSERVIKKRKPWKIDGLTLVVDDDQATLEALQDIQDQHDVVDITIKLVSGTVWGGKGTLVGDDLSAKSMSGTVDVTLSGGRKLEQQ